MNKINLFPIAILGIVLFVAGSLLGGYQFENYSIFSNLISESMAIDTPYGWVLRYFFYLPSGILITLFSLAVISKLPDSKLIQIGMTGFAIFYGIATIVVGVFPCDSGCNKEFINPSTSQIIHNTSGFLTYTLVPVCIILTGMGVSNSTTFKTRSITTGVLSILFVLVLFMNPETAYTGLYQRIVELLFISWILGLAFFIRKSGR